MTMYIQETTLFITTIPQAFTIHSMPSQHYRLFHTGRMCATGTRSPIYRPKIARWSRSVVRTVALVARDLHSLGKMSKIRGFKFRLGSFRSISTSDQRSRTVAHTRPTGRASARPVVLISPQTPYNRQIDCMSVAAIDFGREMGD